MLKFVNYLAPASTVLVSRGARTGTKSVVILGWGGSKARNLHKVREFYEASDNVGDVISFSMPLWAPEFIRKALVRRIVEFLPKRGSGTDVVVHAFSNNGTWVYGEMCQEIENQGDRSEIQKLIIDSAPAFFFEHISLIDAVEKYQPVILSTLLNKDQYRHTVLTPIIKVGLFLVGGAAKIVYRLPLGQYIVPDLIKLSLYLRDECKLIPTLFIYGSDDKLIPEHLITDFSDSLRTRNDEGSPIEGVRFEGAKHVSSFWDKTSRQEYRSKVSQFLGL